MTRNALTALGGAIIVLALLLVLEWMPGFGGGVAPVPPARISAAMAKAAEVPETGDSVDSILARPLFSMSRRPAKIIVSSGGVQQAGIPRLAGIMITPWGRRAIFAPDGGGKALVLAVGAPLQQTSIREIQPDRVVLATGGVLRPAYDKQRIIPSAPANFMPPGVPQPNFAPPNFAAPGFPQPAFQPQGFPPGYSQPGMQQPAAPPSASSAADDTDPNPPSPAPMPQPMFRGPIVPQRRE